MESARAAGPGPCDRFASPTGRNGAAGTRARPWRTAGKLARSLRPGQTGCLRGGTYRGDVTIRGGGRRGRRVTLRAYPRERARVVGTLTVRARYVTISDLFLDGFSRSRLPSPIVAGDHARFVRNDVTNRRTSICFSLGGKRLPVRGVLLARNRIHRCGSLPPTNHLHGVYVERSIGARIRGNWIYDNADRGIQLYPNAQRTTITGNVIDRNGVGIIFSGAGGRASSGTRVRDNVISNARVREVVESFYPRGTPRGRNNLVTRNCLWAGARGRVPRGRQAGFTLVANIEADPRFVNPARGDYRQLPGSACARVALPRGRPGPLVSGG